ncbi:SDR family NAD(P)-dependent oxidoreductase [Streptomyces sp. NPDC050560]|uniref:type I polyketide synthase n=1 Tax=Streptomyces sp. NPDC050560 TaxID=3365630 RepID=UPI0037A9362F
MPVHDLLAGVEEAPPEVLLVPVDGGHQGHADSVESVHRAVRATLALLQEWLGNPAYAESRLVILTRGVRDGSDELVGETVAGLVRSAQSEHPDRIVLLDAPSDTALTLPSLRAAVACGEPEVAVEGDQVWVRRLARLHPSETPAEVPLSGSVLVTGGTGGLGRVVARHLVERGAEHVVLVSRSGREAEGAAELESELAGLGARVTLAACDVADRAGLEELIRGIEPPLTGVVHTAGVLDDGTVESLTADQLARVLRPKAEAAWHLHELTRGLDLTLFALYSSAAAVFGNPGQGNYAAANAFLDALARHRRTQGLPALSLAWGLWAESSGMTTGLGETDLGRLSRYGVRAFSNAEGLALLDAALGSGEAAVLAARIDLRAVAAQEQVPALFKTLVPPRRRWAGSGEETRLPLARRLAGMAEEERERFLLDVVLAHTAAVLGLPAGGVDPENPFKSLGFDSLLAVELRNRLSADIAERLPSTLVFDHPTPGKLTAYLRSRLDLTQAEPETPSYEPLLRELDRLESALAAVEEDGPGRAEVARRLRYLAAQVSPADAETSTPFDVDSASADDIFDFLDKEFG